MGIKIGSKTIVRTIATLCLLMASVLLLAAPAGAQPLPPPNPSSVDENGVDLISGRLQTGNTEVAIGPDDHRGVRFGRKWGYYAWNLTNIPVITGSTSNPVVSFDGKSVPFITTGGVYVPKFPDGSTLNSARTVFTSADGTVIDFGYAGYQYSALPGYGMGGMGTKITYPDGTVQNFNYDTGPYAIFVEWCYCYEYYNIARLSSITSNTGYQIKLTYASDTFPYDPYSFIPWATLTKATALNNAIEYCSPTGGTCSFSNTWPEATYASSGAVVTGPTGGTTTYTYGGSAFASISLPGDSSPSISYTYHSGNNKVASVTRGGGTWSYSYGTNTTTVTDPLSNQRTVNFNSTGLVTSIVAGGQTTSYTYCTGGAGCPTDMLQTVTLPEGNKITYAYDARGNVTSETHIAKVGSGLSNIATSATYPSSCTNAKTCNQPLTTTDARGQVTDYTYDSNNGGLTSIRLPADAAGVRPETRITFASGSARYLTAPSTYSNGTAIWRLSGTSSCRTATSGNPASCVGTAEEQLKSFTYPAGVPNNAQPSSVTTKLGNNTLIATTTITYDNFARTKTVDGPLSADMMHFSYNLAGQTTGVIGADPDGTGTALFPAVRYVYRSDGHVDYVQSGTTTAQSDSAWSSFIEDQRQTIGYDSNHRPSRQTLSSGGTAYQVMDQVYDAAGRVLCSVLRLDGIASPGSLLTSCTPPQTSSANGPDRVAKNVYDALGRVVQVRSAAGTSLESAQVTYGFTSNGRLQYAVDAGGHKTRFCFDGHDRQVRSVFPSTTNPGSFNDSTPVLALSTAGSVNGDCTASTGDFEQVGYDPNGNVTSFRTRRNETINLTYDNLNRMTLKDVPTRSGLATTHTRDVYFGYDLFGGMTSARFDSTSGEGVTNAFNALGQLTSTTTNMDSVSRALSYQYDVAGNLTRITHPDGNYVDHFRTGAGALYYSALNYSYPLFHPTRDAAGRVNYAYRWSTSAGNWYGGVSSYAYDAVSRTSGFTHDLAGSSYDVGTSFTYNPASQIASISRSNDTYAWAGQAAVNRGYTPNGLNQYSAVGGTSFGYDANGNLTSDGISTYVYDVENRLVTRSGGASATLRYDPLGRLYESVSASGTRRFLNDGSDLVAEYNGSGTLLRRYVHGTSAGDDPLVWFEGTTVADSARRYLYADERGSIVAVTDSAGNVTNVNTYDEYGIPGSGNAGAFQYTGQAWLPELGMYYYKARLYSPTLGRFMQTDLIGYGDGMNMYVYVGNDAVNGVDPTGLACTFIQVEGAVGTWSDDCFKTDQGGLGGVGGGDPQPPIPPPGSLEDACNGPLAILMPALCEAVKREKKNEFLTCLGTADFTAVGPNQALASGALAGFGIHPDPKTVAVNPAQFGLPPLPGTLAGNEAVQRQLADLAETIEISSPAAGSRARANGTDLGNTFTIGDIGDRNVRSGSALRLDLYRFGTTEGALGFGRVTLPVRITGVPKDVGCPQGTREAK